MPIGFNPQAGEYTDLVKSAIIGPKPCTVPPASAARVRNCRRVVIDDDRIPSVCRPGCVASAADKRIRPLSTPTSVVVETEVPLFCWSVQVSCLSTGAPTLMATGQLDAVAIHDQHILLPCPLVDEQTKVPEYEDLLDGVDSHPHGNTPRFDQVPRLPTDLAEACRLIYVAVVPAVVHGDVNV